jgi:hypothetical protein
MIAIAGNLRPKNLNLPKFEAFEYKSGSAGRNDSDPFELRGVVYEEDPVKLQQMMDETDRKREAFHRKQLYGA